MRRLNLFAGVAAIMGLLSGCHTAPVKPVPPAPQLLSAAPLEWPNGCAVGGSVIVRFDVSASGEPGNIQPPAAPVCAQTALTAWVASFRYAPQSGATPMSVEWLMVTAKKGG